MDENLAFFHRALEGLQAEIEQAVAARMEAERQVQACDRQLERLRAEYQGIESYVQRHEPRDQQETNGGPVVEPTVDARADGWDTNRVEAVARMLSESSEPLSPGTIVEALSRVGRRDTMKDVAAALSHLKKRGRATNVARGMWVHAEGKNEPVEGQQDVWLLSPDDTEEDDTSFVTTN